ncbi:MAG: helix-turn-helix domain-containing protein [Lactobacillaceae bacterium]
METSPNASFQERFLELATIIQKRPEEIERELGYSKGMLSNLKKGENPSKEVLKELGGYFKVSPDYLVGKIRPASEESIESYFESLSPYYKAKMCSLCQNWSRKYSSKIH